MTQRDLIKNEYPDLSDDEISFAMKEVEEAYGGDFGALTPAQKKGITKRARETAKGNPSSLSAKMEMDTRDLVGSEEYNKMNEKSGGEKLKENVSDDMNKIVKGAEEALTSANSEAEKTGAEKVNKIDTYDHSGQAAKNDVAVTKGEEENEALVNEALADGKLDPSQLTGDQVEQNILKMKDLAGRNILTQDEEGNYSLAPDLTKKEFLKAVGGEKSNITKNILTALSAGLMLFGMPAPNLGKMYQNFSGENYDDLYNEYLTQQTMLREGINSQFADAYGITVKGAASRDDDINKATDKDYQVADDANRSKELGWDLKKLEAEGKITGNQRVKFEDLMKDLDKEQQTYIYDLQARMGVAQQAEMMQYLSKFTPEEVKQFSLKMKQYDPNNSLTKEDLTRLALQTAAGIVNKIVPSDKKTKSFISGAKLFGGKRR